MYHIGLVHRFALLDCVVCNEVRRSVFKPFVIPKCLTKKGRSKDRCARIRSRKDQIQKGYNRPLIYLENGGRDYWKNRKQENETHADGSGGEAVRFTDKVLAALAGKTLPSTRPKQTDEQHKGNWRQCGEKQPVVEVAVYHATDGQHAQVELEEREMCPEGCEQRR